MNNPQLVDYIKQQLAQNVGKEQIKGSLMANGWTSTDVEEGFTAILPKPSAIPQTPVFANQKKSGVYKKIILILLLIIILAGLGWFAFRIKKQTLSVNTPNQYFSLISGDNVFLAKDNDGSFTILKETLVQGEKISTKITVRAREDNIMKKFYNYYPDNYDFVVIFATFPDPNNADYGIVVYNPTRGIGLDNFNNSSVSYGSSGKLKHIASMHDIGKFVNNSMGLTHEISHYWLMYISDPGIETNRGGTPFGHWSNFMDTATRNNGFVELSLMYGYPFKDNGNGTFSVDDTSPRVYNKFNSIELYLMGLLPASEAKPLTFWKTNSTQVQGIMTGTKQIVTVDDLIKIAGSRIPAYPDTQRDFKIAYILLPKQGEVVDPTHVKNIKWIAENFPSEWYSATRGLSTVK